MTYYPLDDDFDYKDTPFEELKKIEELSKLATKLNEIRKDFFKVSRGAFSFPELDYSNGTTRFMSWLYLFCDWSKTNSNMSDLECLNLIHQYENATPFGSGYGSNENMVNNVFIKPFIDKIRSEILERRDGSKVIVDSMKKQMDELAVKLSNETTPSNEQTIVVNGDGNRFYNSSIDNSINVTNSDKCEEYLSQLRGEAVKHNFSKEDFEKIDAIEDLVKKDKPSKAVLSLLVDSLPKVGSVASIGSFLLKLFQ